MGKRSRILLVILFLILGAAIVVQFVRVQRMIYQLENRPEGVPFLPMEHDPLIPYVYELLVISICLLGLGLLVILYSS